MLAAAASGDQDLGTQHRAVNETYRSAGPLQIVVNIYFYIIWFEDVKSIKYFIISSFTNHSSPIQLFVLTVGPIFS